MAPSLWGFAAVVAGVVMLFFGRTRRAARWVLAGGAAWLVLLSLGVPFEPVGRWLEARHPAVVDVGAVPDLDGAPWVVVLGGGHRADARLPASAHLPEQALYRVVEGVRLHRALPGSRLLFVGYGGEGRPAAADVAARLALALGVEAGSIVTDGSPRTTAEEARAVRALVVGVDAPVLLVTSALHMPRAVRLFELAGVPVVPAPTGHAALQRRSARDWLLPRSARLPYADAVARELVAGLAARGGRGVEGVKE